VPATPPFSRWCPPEITRAAGPLRETAGLLKALTGDRSRLAGLVASAPSAEVRDALDGFVGRWELSLWDLSGTAESLAQNLRWAAEDYLRHEADLVRRLAQVADDRTGTRGVPAS
jgi:hypothetical protein